MIRSIRKGAQHMKTDHAAVRQPHNVTLPHEQLCMVSSADLDKLKAG